MNRNLLKGEQRSMQLTALVTAAQSGDKAAFDQLVGRFQDMAYAEAFAIIGDAHLAQDAAQEAFLGAYQNLAQLREPAAFPGWFRRIVQGCSYRQARSKPVTELPLDDLPDLADGRGDPLEKLQAIDEQQSVRSALAGLTSNQRLAVALYYIEGYSQREIADYLEAPVSAVKKRLFDARQRLKERMIHMVQAELQAGRPSQDDTFARRVQFFTALLAGESAQVEQLLNEDASLMEAKVEWKMALKRGYAPLGSTALHLAVVQGNDAMARLLLAQGADVEAKNVGDNTPLQIAAIMQRPKMARLLLAHDAQVDARSKVGQTALHHAALRGDLATVEILLEHGADVAAPDREGHTPSDLAVLRNYQEIVQRMAAHGAPPAVARPAEWTAAPSHRAVLVTGIKAIDLLTPLPRGGRAGVFTPLAGVGFSVLLAQLIKRVQEVHRGYAVYVGLESDACNRETLQLAWRELDVHDAISYHFGSIEDQTDQRVRLVEQAFAEASSHAQAGQETLLLFDSNVAGTPGVLAYLDAQRQSKSSASVSSGLHATADMTTLVHGHHTLGVLPAGLDDLMTLITFNGMLARQRLYPAIDPARSVSHLLTQGLVDSDHADIATQARRLLQRYMDIHPVVEAGGMEALWYIDDDPQLQQTVRRARRLQRFLTQPFYGVEPWTGLMAQLVSLDETIRGCRAILQGECDDLPEEAFLYVGTLDEAVSDGKR